MNDILAQDTPRWQFIEQTVGDVLAAYGYQEIRLPIVEKTELFKRSIGEMTDIVEKEMYTFEDRNGDSLTLRPEGTAGCVRAVIQNGLIYNQQQRFWYAGPMFRHERPQKGRYRQFHQIGVEAFGMPGPDVDAEVIAISDRIFRRLGIDTVTLEINTLGTASCRAAYRDVLVQYFRDHQAALDEDSLRRLESNPLRILDSKNPAMQAVIAAAPQLADYLDDESRAHFDRLRELLDRLNIRYRLNPRLVRGLDYYTHVVFEWVTDRLGAQNAVCSGGRYDGLVSQLGGSVTPAVGFALGLERTVALLELSGHAGISREPQVYLVCAGEQAELVGLSLAEQLRNEVPDLRVQCNCGGGSFKAQLKRADRSGAEIAVILGEREANSGQAQIKPLRVDREQMTVGLDTVAETIVSWLGTQVDGDQPA